MESKIIKVIICAVLFLCSVTAYTQSLPAGTAGIVYTYDATGNRTKVEYVLNNTKTAISATVKTDSVFLGKKFEEQVLKVDALYPNPTTGKITVRLAKPLRSAIVEIMDVTGRVLIKGTGNGLMLDYDLSRFPSGVYLLYIEEKGQKVTMKIIKR